MCFLFTEKNRHPSTIEGYRTAIADTLRNSPLDISNNAEIARLIASFHMDKPKSSRALPTWDLSLFPHQLTQPPFEPLQEAFLKYVTWKMILLALASRKRRSEIHAWTMDGDGSSLATYRCLQKRGTHDDIPADEAGRNHDRIERDLPPFKVNRSFLI